MSTEYVDRTTDVPLDQISGGHFPYPGLPTTCDGAEAVVWVETNISQGSGAYPITSSNITRETRRYSRFVFIWTKPKQTCVYQLAIVIIIRKLHPSQPVTGYFHHLGINPAKNLFYLLFAGLPVVGLRPWVEFFVNLAQSFLVNVCVNLGSSYIHVCEHFLHTSQVGSAGQ